METRPTIKHIAAMCGVSAATVSYVINGKETLRPETRARVMKAMEDLNYHPSAVARGLQSKRVNTLGILFGSISPIDFADHSYVTGLLRGIMKCAREEGFNITFFTEGWKDAATSAPSLADGRTDGVIAIAPRLTSDMLEGLRGRNIAHVAISAGENRDSINVDIDNEAGIRMATEHLLGLGHRRIAFFNGNDDLASYQPRRAGFLAALHGAGIAPRADWMLDTNFDGHSTFEPARAFLQKAREANDLPTAVCAANDHIALAVMKAAQSLDIDVPGQLSLTGFDDIAEAKGATPALTTLRQPLEQIGATATQLLIERVRAPKQKATGTRLIQPELIARESSAPPRSSN